MMALVCPWQHPLTKICECLGAPYNHERIRKIIPKIATYRPGIFVRGIPGDFENDNQRTFFDSHLHHSSLKDYVILTTRLIV